LATDSVRRQHRLLEVRGNPYERGHQYGAHFKPLLNRLLKANYRYYLHKGGTTKEGLLRRASSYRRYTEDFSSAVGDEIRGMADAAGVKVDEVYVLAAFNELYYPTPNNRCTSFAVRDGATRDGLTFVGQNNDEAIEPWLNGECVTFTRHVQRGAPNVLVYTYAGVPAQMGVNSHGFALCVNALHFDKATTGVPVFCLAREVLNQRSVDDAIQMIRDTKRPYSLNFVMGDTKRIVDVESTPRALEVTTSDDIIFHTNHYVCSKDPRIGSQRGKRYRNTKTRCKRIEELLLSKKGRLDLGTLETFLRDHENWPDAICCHSGAREGPGAKVKTFDSMIYIPEKREAWLTRGNPCEAEFVRYSA
jgi:isopenicillin-N N-acyltransferase-like protein